MCSSWLPLLDRKPHTIVASFHSDIAYGWSQQLHCIPSLSNNVPTVCASTRASLSCCGERTSVLTSTPSLLKFEKWCPGFSCHHKHVRAWAHFQLNGRWASCAGRAGVHPKALCDRRAEHIAVGVSERHTNWVVAKHSPSICDEARDHVADEAGADENHPCALEHA